MKGNFDLITSDELFETICSRRNRPSSGSYTARLFARGKDEIIKKVGEEATEVVLAASSQGRERLIEEIADLTYHVLVLMAANSIEPDDIRIELGRRHQ